MLDIEIKTIADTQQRYNTVGDYYINEEGKRIFRISDMGNWKYELLIAVHELVESALCKDRGISDASIDAFDMAYEENRDSADIHSEPGNDPNAPYYHEHQFATKIERLLAEELQVDWDTYCEACAALTKE